MKATKLLFKWHHWCGLVVGLFILMMSITGSLLVFSEEWETLEAKPSIQEVVGRPGFDASFRMIQQQYPDWEIRLYHLPQANEPLVYELRQKDERKKVYVHPVTGALIHINENANNSFQRQLLLLHYTLLSGTKGKIIIFFVGVLFLITLITGLVVYRHSLLKVFTFKIKFNWKTRRSSYSSLHRIVGVWSLLFNLLIVVSGLWLSGQIALNALKAPAGNPAPPKSTAAITSIDAIVQKLAAEHPDFETHLIRIRAGSTVVGVSGRLLHDPKVYGNYYSGFTFDGVTGAETSSFFMQDMSWGKRLGKMAAPLHFGTYGGMLLKIVYCLLGLTPALLSISGFVLWRRRGKGAAAAKKKKPVLETAS